MPGFNDQDTNRFKWPEDTWLAMPPSGNTFLLQLHTSFMPEDSRGVWGHQVTLPKKDRPVWCPCPRNDKEGIPCLLCEANAAFVENYPKADKKDKPYPMRTQGFAIGSLVAVAKGVTWEWLNPPKHGLVERGPEFWKTLAALEMKAAEPPSELSPNKAVLPDDWRKWYIKVTTSKDGITGEIYPAPAAHPLIEMDMERLAYYGDLFQKRIQPWDDIKGLIERSLTNREPAPAASPTTPAQAPASDPALAEKWMVLQMLPLKGAGGEITTGGDVLKPMFGPRYGASVTFDKLNDDDKAKAIQYVEAAARKQNVKIAYEDMGAYPF